MRYTCPRCGYTTILKSDMRRHLKRKNPCIVTLYNINVKDYQEEILQGKILSLCNICNGYATNLESHLEKCREKEEEKEVIGKLMDLVNTLNEKLEEEKKERKEDRKKLDTLVEKPVGNITQNITNNILVLPYRETDLSHLKGRDFYKSLDKCIYAVPQLIERTHFNPYKPENHNIYISNLSRNHAMVFDGKKWIVKNQDQMIDRLIRENEFRLEDWIEEGAKKFPKAMEKFKLYMSKRDEDGVPEIIREEVRMLLYNNRELVAEIKEKKCL